LKRPDWLTIAIYLILVITGWFSIYSAASTYDATSGGSFFDLQGRAGMQMLWIWISLAVGFSLLMIESNWYEVFATWIYMLIMGVLLLTIFIAPNIKGSHSWLVLGPIRFQPAELAKFATALMVAKCMSAYQFDLLKMRNFTTVISMIFLPMLLILMQNETGSALVFLSFFFVLYREGLPGAILLCGISAILFFVLNVRFANVFWGQTTVGECLVLALIILFSWGFLYNHPKHREHLKYMVYALLGMLSASAIVDWWLPVFDWCWTLNIYIALMSVYLFVLFVYYRSYNYLWIALFALGAIAFSYSVDYVYDEVLQAHQKTRIDVALGMIEDPNGAGYNVIQSKIAIGSGGLTGKGFMRGTQTKLKYVPEQDTDFIFCTIGEEKGFVGATVVLLLFVGLILRLIYLAERQSSAFHRIYGYIVAGILFFHILVNIGMVIGIMPVIGIPLPFFSYGGSSLLSFTILLFIFLCFDASREYK